MPCCGCCRRGKRNRDPSYNLIQNTTSPKPTLMSPIFRNQHFDSVSEGMSFIFTGVINPTCNKFSIALRVNNEFLDIALIISPHLPQHYISRRCRVQYEWLHSEMTSSMPFTMRRGSRFTIEVLVAKECYMIVVNGQHFAEYRHYLPYADVNCIEVAGDIDKLQVQYGEFRTYSEDSSVQVVPRLNDFSEVSAINVPHSPEAVPSQVELHTAAEKERVELPVPYYGRLPKRSLTAGRCLSIEGRVKMLPHSFTIDLQRGKDIWPHPPTALRFHARYAENIDGVFKNNATCMAWKENEWSAEERSDIGVNFQPGRNFSLIIVSGIGSYELYVNQKLSIKFMYRLNPDVVDMVHIEGDIKLWRVVLVSSLRFKSTHSIETSQPKREGDFSK